MEIMQRVLIIQLISLLSEYIKTIARVFFFLFVCLFAYVNMSNLNVEEGVRNVVFALHSHIKSNRHIVHYAEKF